jgi:hypothetical protein
VDGQDASTVLPAMEGSQEYRCTHLEQTVLPLKCVNLGAKSHPEDYHEEVGFYLQL